MPRVGPRVVAGEGRGTAQGCGWRRHEADPGRGWGQRKSQLRLKPDGSVLASLRLHVSGPALLSQGRPEPDPVRPAGLPGTLALSGGGTGGSLCSCGTSEHHGRPAVDTGQCWVPHRPCPVGTASPSDPPCPQVIEDGKSPQMTGPLAPVQLRLRWGPDLSSRVVGGGGWDPQLRPQRLQPQDHLLGLAGSSAARQAVSAGAAPSMGWSWAPSWGSPSQAALGLRPPPPTPPGVPKVIPLPTPPIVLVLWAQPHALTRASLCSRTTGCPRAGVAGKAAHPEVEEACSLASSFPAPWPAGQLWGASPPGTAFVSGCASPGPGRVLPLPSTMSLSLIHI